MSEYVVIFEPGDRNWSAYVPDLPGCIATGKTLEATKALISETIEFHIEGLRARGKDVPPPTTQAATVQISA